MISLIHPSRSRPEKALETFKNWINKASGENHIEYILSIDDSDPEKEKYLQLFDNAYVHPNDCVVQAANNGAANSTGDILIYLSDDFDCPQNWDRIIVSVLAFRLFPGQEKVMLHVNDGLQPMSNAVLTIPIMTRALYNELGSFFHKEYKSMWCDVDLYWSTKQYMVDAPEIIFEHKHHSRGHCANDETYKRSELNWEHGLEIYNRRALQFGWPQKRN